MWGCRKQGQSVIEYFIIFAIVVGAILATGIITPRGEQPSKIREIFQGYFTQAVQYLR